MSRRWSLSILILWGLVASLLLGMLTDDLSAVWVAEGAEVLDSASPATAIDRSPTATRIRQEQTAPQKARDVLAQIQARQGEPVPGYVGGREFQNREHRLPPGRYREYDVNPKIRGRSRGAERIVIEQDTGVAYYTGNHYRTFIPLTEIP